VIDTDTRPWGKWEAYLKEAGYCVKRLVVSPGKRTSLQKHRRRSEHWVVVAGRGRILVNGQTREVAVGDTAYVAQDEEHRIENHAVDPLVIIETQIGECDESDISRLSDDWGRT
jgi:mannose-6-phosphate isomerase-like protein (cupin superfamily)